MNADSSELIFHISTQCGHIHVFTSGGIVNNYLLAGGKEITADLADSFIFVMALMNIVPDATPFRRGDSNGDNHMNLADALATLNFVFLNGNLGCLDAADVNDDGELDVSDPLLLLFALYEPGLHQIPGGTDCARDPGEELGCEAYAACE